MSEKRTATERLDALLAGLEDGVLGAGAAAQVEPEKTGPRESVEMIRSEIDALIGSHSPPAVVREPRAGVEVPTLGAKVAARVARLGRRVGLGPQAGGGSGALRVRMAFSGSRSETGEKPARKEACRRKGAPDDEGGQGAG